MQIEPYTQYRCVLTESGQQTGISLDKSQVEIFVKFHTDRGVPAHIETREYYIHETDWKSVDD